MEEKGLSREKMRSSGRNSFDEYLFQVTRRSSSRATLRANQRLLNGFLGTAIALTPEENRTHQTVQCDLYLFILF